MTTVLGFPVVTWGSTRIGTYLIPGTSVRLTMCKEVAPLLVALARDFEREVEPLHPGWCWGFNPKHIEGTSAWSNHAWGGAIDLNAPLHPLGAINTFSPSRRAAVHAILARYTYKGARIFRWGGDYTSRRDDMHFEVNVPRPVALAAVAALQKASTPAKPPAGSKSHAPGSRLLELRAPAMSGADVGFVQRWIGRARCGAADLAYGPQTASGVRWYQRQQGLVVDGAVGPATWKRMGK